MSTAPTLSDVLARRQRPQSRPRPAGSPGWLHLCNGLDPERDGGMVPSILGMTSAIRRGGDDVAIVTPTPSRIDASSLEPGLTLRGPEADLEAAVRGAGVVHMHGLWQGHTRRGARAARAAGVPYVITAHGMAEPWALRHKRLKKSVYLALVESRNLRRAACLHALSRPEIGHLRRLAPRTPVCFVPNGVDLSRFDGLPARAELEAEHPQLAGKFVLLFFGRLHLKKGLDLLADALRALAPEFPSLHVVLAGRDDGARAPFAQAVREAGLEDRVTAVGHVEGEAARRAWAAADAFVLPSYSEGFSMAILEALACRLPCLITNACHFPELAAAGGAVVAEPTSGDITRGLRTLLEMTPEERRRMGATGRRLVERDYTWDQQARRLSSVYRWLAGGGDRPDCVLP
ncbi:Spore coat protein SA [Aquisphaera giovannonii]|uniref:Spore coat protein SA n=1 Tax=Aquisphaera giovannonii TaxID=406548 RepID=A0A5B9VVA4_9BACT|nr:glycosyltransferase [Aquisphaera giovannonii]QEH31705.1 Spore coat protein SA [Aquisphaera giovannonii]